MFDENALQTVRERRFLINKYDDWLFDEIRPFIGENILEIGCGLGNLFVHFLDRKMIVGIDNNEACINQVREKFINQANLSVYCIDITDSQSLRFLENQLDTVVSLNVFEHIENEDAAYATTREVLRTGGYFIVIVPAHQALYGSLDRSIGHFRRYTKRYLAEKLGSFGFEIKTQKYMNMLGAIGWFVNGKILRQSVPPSSQLTTINAITPVLRRIEKHIKAPFGISLLTVAQKVS